MPRARERVMIMPPKMMRKLMVIIVLPTPIYSKTIPKVIIIRNILIPFAIRSPYLMFAL
jgi:hypothetical protein